MQWRYPAGYEGVAFQLQVGFELQGFEDEVSYIAPAGGDYIRKPADLDTCWSPSDTLDIGVGSFATGAGGDDCVRFIITGLAPGTIYPIQVKAIFDNAESSEFTLATIETRGAAAGPDIIAAITTVQPHDYKAVRIGNDSIHMQWRYDDNFQGSHFQIRLQTLATDLSDAGSQAGAVEISPDGGQDIVRRRDGCWAESDTLGVNEGPPGNMFDGEVNNCTRFLIRDLEPGSDYYVILNAVDRRDRLNHVRGETVRIFVTTKGERTNQVALYGPLPPREVQQIEADDQTSLKLRWLYPNTFLRRHLAHYEVKYLEYFPETGPEYVTADGGAAIREGKVTCYPENPAFGPKGDCTEFTIRNLLPYTSYRVRVFAHYSAPLDEGGYMISLPAEGSYRTDPDLFRPETVIRSGKPDSLAVRPNDPGDDTTLTMQWQPPDVAADDINRPTVWHIEYRLRAGTAVYERPDGWNKITLADNGRACYSGTGQCLVFPIPGLNDENEYYVRVTGAIEGANGNGNRKSATPLFGGPFRIDVPTVPSVMPPPAHLTVRDVAPMSGTVNQYQATLEWKQPAPRNPEDGVIDGIIGYDITWRRISIFPGEEVEEVAGRRAQGKSRWTSEMAPTTRRFPGGAAGPPPGSTATPPPSATCSRTRFTRSRCAPPGPTTWAPRRRPA